MEKNKENFFIKYIKDNNDYLKYIIKLNDNLKNIRVENKLPDSPEDTALKTIKKIESIILFFRENREFIIYFTNNFLEVHIK